MTGYSTRKNSGTQIKNKESRLQRVSKGSPTKVTSKKNAGIKKISKAKNIDTSPTGKLTTRSKRITTRKQGANSVESDKSTTEKEKIVVKRRTLYRRAKKVSVHANSSTKKNESANIKSRKSGSNTNKNTKNLRQMSLQDSFKNQSKMKIYSAQVSIHKNENSTKKPSTVSSKRHNIKESKLPIYKCHSPESSAKNESEVYEFKFDANDAKERLPKKRKGRPAGKKAQVTKKKKVKFAMQKFEVKKELQKNISINVQIENVAQENVGNRVMEETNAKKESHTVPSSTPENVNVKQNVEVNNENLHRSMQESSFVKPAIISINDVSNHRIKIVDNSPIAAANKFMPFKPTNIFNNKLLAQQKNTFTNSFFDKSLSPIAKTLQDFDLNSPWRTPSVFTFSQVKNVFQSTPQNNKSKNYGNTTEFKDIAQMNNENISLEGLRNTNAPKKGKFRNSRKFGTEITNLNQSVPPNPIEETRERIIIEAESVQPSSVTDTSMSNFSKYDDQDRKENSVTTYQSPKKVHYIKKGIYKMKPRSPLKAANVQTSEHKENIPGVLGDLSKNTLNVLQNIGQKENILPARVKSPLKEKNIVLDNEQNKNIISQPGLLSFQNSKMLTQSNKQTENTEPQPGPSGLQKLKTAFQSNVQKENIAIEPGLLGSQNSKMLTQSHKQIENIEPQAGPSGLQKLKTTSQSIEQKENVDPQHTLLSNLQKSPGNTLNVEQKENINPPSAASGLPKRTVLNESRVLRQSSLNSFLNIMEVPENTSITTPHGIFDDIHSTPIHNRQVGKLNTSKIELENAFGFSDEDSKENMPLGDSNISIDKNKQKNVIESNAKRSDLKPFTRISVGQIKNTLVRNNQKEDVKIDKKVKNMNVEKPKSQVKGKKKSHIDITNFSDTFDVLSEADDVSESNTSAVPLFADLEPSHFTQPPRHSYKRKRAVKFSMSEESSAEDEEEKKFEIKRKKYDKMKKEDEHRLRNWIENINRTFGEIDEHDLLVE